MAMGVSPPRCAPAAPRSSPARASTAMRMAGGVGLSGRVMRRSPSAMEASSFSAWTSELRRHCCWYSTPCPGRKAESERVRWCCLSVVTSRETLSSATPGSSTSSIRTAGRSLSRDTCQAGVFNGGEVSSGACLDPWKPCARACSAPRASETLARNWNPRGSHSASRALSKDSTMAREWQPRAEHGSPTRVLAWAPPGHSTKSTKATRHTVAAENVEGDFIA
mmetsp:Transcript_24685/g.72385  ORF Transcript_24685/g.72385 Transcript_24685/m.72385 type:complete len:222 (-) Transcript_24685:511-1176(-)